MKICPKCQHKQTEWEKSLSPHECPQCGFFYNAREHINAEKRQQNLKLTPWRVTRWRPQSRTGLIFGVPTVMIVLYVVYQFGQFVITNSRPISNKLYQFAKTESDAPAPKRATDSLPSVPLPASVTDSILTVTARKTVTVWFIDQTTNKKNGPFLITRNKPEKIHLERGIYTAKIINDGRLSMVTVNFMSMPANLEL